MPVTNTSLSVVVLTHNEEVNLPACLESLSPLACEIFVVDSGSTDRTAEIARAAGADVIHHPFDTQARQLNWALDTIPFKSDWVLRLDADERLTPELAGELGTALPGLGDEVTGLYVKRRVYFMGRWMRHGGYYPTWLLRLWRNGCARAEDRAMDEHMVLLRGHAAYLKHDIEERNQKGLFAWVERQNSYSTREVNALTERSMQPEISPSFFGRPEQRRRWLKYSVYLRFPLFLRAFLYFVWRYFFQLGFLDHREGLIFHFLQACWLRFLIDAKLYEARLEQPQTQLPKEPVAAGQFGERRQK